MLARLRCRTSGARSTRHSTRTIRGRRSPVSPPAGPVISTPGRASAMTAATRSSATRTTGSATTAASTRCGRTAGAARATSAGSTRRNRGFLRALRGLAQMAAVDRRDRRGRTLPDLPRPTRARRRPRRPAEVLPAAVDPDGRREPADGSGQGDAADRRRADGGAHRPRSQPATSTGRRHRPAGPASRRQVCRSSLTPSRRGPARRDPDRLRLEPGPVVVVVACDLVDLDAVTVAALVARARRAIRRSPSPPQPSEPGDAQPLCAAWRVALAAAGADRRVRRRRASDPAGVDGSRPSVRPRRAVTASAT